MGLLAFLGREEEFLTPLVSSIDRYGAMILHIMHSVVVPWMRN